MKQIKHDRENYKAASENFKNKYTQCVLFYYFVNLTLNQRLNLPFHWFVLSGNMFASFP